MKKSCFCSFKGLVLKSILSFIAILFIFVHLGAQDTPLIPFVSRECWSGSEQCTKEFTLTGEMIFVNRPANRNDCDGLSSIILFVPDAVSLNRLKGVLFYGGDRIKVDVKGNEKLYKELEETLPKWYKDGLMGEVQLYVRGDFYDFAPASMVCNGGWIYEIKARNVKIIEKGNESLSDKRGYTQVYGDTHFTYERIVLDSSQPQVAIHQFPQGKIIAKIKTNAQNYGFLYRLDGDYNNHWGGKGYPIDFGGALKKADGTVIEGWIKVIYFPPNETSSQRAIVGYIEESFIKGSVMSLDIIEVDSLITPPSQDFQKVQRPKEPAEQKMPTREEVIVPQRRIIRTPY